LAQILNDLGLVYFRRGSLIAAENALRTALDIPTGPDWTDANTGIVYSNLPDVLAARGEYESTRSLFTRFLPDSRKRALVDETFTI
jgi:Flp pilus assembly protein TadD